MLTKQTGDISEQAAALHALKRGWGVLRAIGDRLPYDLVFDVCGCLINIQVKTAWLDVPSGNLRQKAAFQALRLPRSVKTAWLDVPSGNYVVDNRRTKTNRRLMVREAYQITDFDFALTYLAELDIFYVIPIELFISYGSEIHIVETDKRQRKPRSTVYRDAWHLIV